MNKAALALAVSGTLLVVAGCGGSSAPRGSSSTTRGTVTTPNKRDEPHASQSTLVLAKANAICNRLNAELEADKPASKSIAEIARVTPRHIEYETRSVDELSRLTPPTATAAQWRLMISARRALAAELVELERAAKAGNEAAIKGLAVSKKRVHAKLAAAATHAGLTGCTEVG